MTIYISNAFSLSMIKSPSAILYVKEIDINNVKELLANGFVSAIGHESTANLLSQILDVQISANRINVKLEHGDILIVFQLLQRLPEGKVLTVQELQQIIQQGQAKFYVVKMSS